MYVCTCVCMHVCMYICRHVYIYMYAFINTCMYVCMYACMYGACWVEFCLWCLHPAIALLILISALLILWHHEFDQILWHSGYR